MTFIEPSEPTAIGPEPQPYIEPVAEVEIVEPTPIAEDAGFDQLPAHWQEQIRKARDEAADYRTKAREAESVWEGWEDAAQKANAQEYMRLMPLAERGDPAAAARIAELFGEEPEETPEPVTREELFAEARKEAARETQRLLGEREAQQRQVESLRNIETEVTKRGYELDSEEHLLFLRAANKAKQSDSAADVFEAGEKAVKAYHQQIVEKYLAEKEREANGSARQSSGTAPSNAVNPDKPWEGSGLDPMAWARKSLDERLSAQL